MNLDDFSYEENGRRYINPQVSLDEQNAFIDNLRNMQQTDTAKITQDTHNLGSNLPSNLGGLGGGTSYFKSRYQTPQTNSMISDLRATAQAQALSTVMSNELAKAKKRYQDAYKKAKSRSGSGGGSNDDSLSELPVLETNDYGAGDKRNTSEASGDDLVLAPQDQKQLALDNARKNLRIWEDRLNAYDNPVTMVLNYGTLGDVMNRVQRARDEVSELEKALGE